MDIETILNAMDEVWIDYYIHRIERRYRQFHAFRARILKMDAEKDELIAELELRNAALSDPMYFTKLIGGRK